MSKRGVGWRPAAFREMALRRLVTCEHVGNLCNELGISRSTLKRWRRQLESGGEPASAAVQLPVQILERENRRLKDALAEKVLEVDFLQGALQQIEARRQQNILSGARASTPRSGE